MKISKILTCRQRSLLPTRAIFCVGNFMHLRYLASIDKNQHRVVAMFHQTLEAFTFEKPDVMAYYKEKAEQLLLEFLVELREKRSSIGLLSAHCLFCTPHVGLLPRLLPQYGGFSSLLTQKKYLQTLLLHHVAATMSTESKD